VSLRGLLDLFLSACDPAPGPVCLWPVVSRACHDAGHVLPVAGKASARAGA